MNEAVQAAAPAIGTSTGPYEWDWSRSRIYLLDNPDERPGGGLAQALRHSGQSVRCDVVELASAPAGGPAQLFDLRDTVLRCPPRIRHRVLIGTGAMAVPALAASLTIPFDETYALIDCPVPLRAFGMDLACATPCSGDRLLRRTAVLSPRAASAPGLMAALAGWAQVVLTREAFESQADDPIYDRLLHRVASGARIGLTGWADMLHRA